jgi:hypothetical protein
LKFFSQYAVDCGLGLSGKARRSAGLMVTAAGLAGAGAVADTGAVAGPAMASPAAPKVAMSVQEVIAAASWRLWRIGVSRIP